ncbi:DgyrCDS4773 [Dimorphilus gyrociliatus]|uniref:DgyrCDS4773 n=1 Tax=Dimorphilus gyrociliatus TaxID=2664684 RepID=A0A7I8VMN8_9ANNE|nr:DgyrCDS4773 [Dimorphilus gyrociliatus]
MRPTSGKSTTRSRDEFGSTSRTVHVNAGSGDVTYEDVLVSRYLEALQSTPTKYSTVAGPSPFKQKFVETHAFPRHRPVSAYSSATSESSYRRGRPVSAPAFRRPLSSTYGSRPASAKSTASKVKSLYRKLSRPIVCTAFKNGDRSIFCRVTAPDFRTLLDLCTDKLGLTSAARRAFYDDGMEITKHDSIERDAEVYISCGENFKDPFTGAKRSIKLSKKVNWTVGGVVQTGETKKQFTKPRISKRMKKMLESNKRRILVFKNGKGTEGVEIVADADRFEEFLVACTAKLDLRGFAKTLFDWEGTELLGFWNVPILDTCLQTSTTPVLGPVWVGTGEPFSPKGVVEFLEGLIAYTKAKLKEAKIYKNQLQMAQEAAIETDDVRREQLRSGINITTILSMELKQISSTSVIVARDLDDFTNALNHLKEQMEKLKEPLFHEKELAADYSHQHIPKINKDNRLIRSANVKLRVFKNGTYNEPTIVFFNIQLMERGLRNDKDKEKKLFEKLLDTCAEAFRTSGSRKLAKKLFDISGKELCNVYDLQDDQEVWLGFDDHFKSFHTYAVSAVVDKVRCYKGTDGKLFGIREQLMKNEVDGKTKNHWITHSGFGENFDIDDISHADSYTIDVIMSQAETAKLPPDITYLVDKTDSNLIVYPEVGVDVKSSKESIFPQEAQIWVLSKDRYIHCKHLPQLVLGASDHKVTAKLRHPTEGETNIGLQGYVVTLQEKQNGNRSQTWTFTKEGHIYAESQPALFLTYVGSKVNDEEGKLNNEEVGLPSGVKIYLAVCELIEDNKWSKAQKFAFKQEKLENLGQWKHTKVQNTEWSKRALSWPVDEQGSLNEDYQWPMEGYLLPYAPPMQKKISSTPASNPPLRLLTLKNGVRDIRQAVSVVGPDLTNMKKDLNKGKSRNSKKFNPEDEDMNQNDDNLSILKLEFILFLESATSLLNLPFAGRRLFDEKGREHTNLEKLNRDQLVYISCGEPWSNPFMTKSEQQRRYLLSNLGSDITHIRQFVRLRDGEGKTVFYNFKLIDTGLVLEAENLRPGAKVIVNSKIHTGPESDDDGELLKDEIGEGDNASFNQGSLSSHDRSHIQSEDWLNKRKWPWERTSNGGIDEVKAANQQEKAFTNQSLVKKFRRKRRKDPTGNSIVLQKFYLDDEYIVARANSDLVLGIEESEGRTRSVILVKRKIDDIFQRWSVRDNGVIAAKFNSSVVLTVSMPSATVNGEDDVQCSYIGNPIVVAPKKTVQFGRANQKWQFDSDNNLLLAFATTKEDLEITAANCANVCTATVMGQTEIDQQGYEVNLAKKGEAPLKVCTSCARSLRGRYKMEKIIGNVDFTCDMASAKQLGIKQVGSLKCLMGKVDLSTHEAEHTLLEWTKNFEKMKQELSVRSLAQSLNAARSPYTVKILAYKNGDGRLRPPVTIIGSSIRGILDQATHRLNLGWRANRLYTANGNLYLDIDSLIEGVRDQYVEEAKQQLQSERAVEEEKEEQKSSGSQNVEKIYGHQVLDERPLKDKWSSIVIIPNPESQAVTAPCTLGAWHYHAQAPGLLYLQIWRPDPKNDVKDKPAYSLVVQVQQDIKTEGEYELDATTIEEWQSSGGIHLEPGYVFGFYCPDQSVLAYDIVESRNESPLCCQISADHLDGSILFTRLPQSKERNYSMSIKVFLDEPPPAPKKEVAKPANIEIEKPPIDMILPYPIEAWFSCGEQFIEPEKVETKHSVQIKERDERSNVSYELEKQKHILRQIQGRRIESLSSGVFRSTNDPDRPVLIDGNWMHPSHEEKEAHDKVHQLTTHLSEMKDMQQSRKKQRRRRSTRLYVEPSLKRILVYPNGESIHRAVYIWGDSLSQLLDHATTRLNLNKASKYIFTVEGKLIEDENELEKDQLVCASNTKQFMKPKEYDEYIEMRARWGRDWKKYGSQITDLVVTAKKSEKVDVDPFGPAKSGNKSNSKKKTNTQKK